MSDALVTTRDELPAMKNTVTARSPLIAIQRNGHKPAFFCVHPVGGNVLCYCTWSRKLGADQPFYGLQDPRVNGDITSGTTIEQMASDYVAAIRTAQPEGPYYLGGWSMGGVIAYEMAQQITAQCSEVALLVMLDSHFSTRPSGHCDGKNIALVRKFAKDIGLPTDQIVLTKEMQGMTNLQQLESILRQAIESGLMPCDTNVSELQHLFEVFVENYTALHTYTPKPYPGSVTLFRPRASASNPKLNPALGWDKLASGGVTEHFVSGNHYTMLCEPHVRFFAERFRNSLNEACRLSTTSRRVPATLIDRRS